ncbi:hypothetical protein Tco_0832829 [Tanacetum coccineum]
MIKFYNVCTDLVDFADMAPLPPREQRNLFLRYQGLEYSNQDIADFKERLERIHDSGTHRVQVLDFEGMPELMRDVLYARMRMEHLDGDRVVVFTSQEEMESPGFARYWSESERMIPRKGDLRDYWRDIYTDGDLLGPPPSYTLIRDSVLRLCHKMMAHSIAVRSQAPEKVTMTDLFYLRGLDVGSVNIPYLLARYLRRFAAGRKSRALISDGQFICVEFRDTWAWVLVGPARQEGDAGRVVEEALVAPGGGDEDEEMPQAVPPLPRTQGERIARLEEVHGMHEVLQGQREVLDSMARDFSRFTTWTVTSLSRMMDRAGVTYTRYSKSLVEYQRRIVRRRTNSASTSTASHQPDL